MKIWVDADACPRVIKDILFRAAKRVGVPLILVANQPIQIPLSPYISKIVVPQGFDVADQHIVEAISAEDLVITADIPLANLVTEKGAIALNPRGHLYTQENIKHTLAMRNLMTELRESGIIRSGTDKLSNKESSAFANQLDRLLASYSRQVRRLE